MTAPAAVTARIAAYVTAHPGEADRRILRRECSVTNTQIDRAHTAGMITADWNGYMTAWYPATPA